MNLISNPHRLRWILLGLALLIAAMLTARWFLNRDADAKEAWQPPRYQNLEVYLLRRDRLTLAPSSQGCKGLPNLQSVSPEAHLKFGYTCGNSGELPYKLEIEYLKRSTDGNDTYLAQCTIPVSNTTSRHTTEIVTYSGKNLELFRDDHFVLGLRPAPTSSIPSRP